MKILQFHTLASFLLFFCLSQAQAADISLAWYMHRFGIRTAAAESSMPPTTTRQVRSIEEDNNCQLRVYNEVRLKKRTRVVGYEALLYCDEGPELYVGVYFDRNHSFLSSMAFGMD